ncbi:spore germination protein [Bacillus toyonensis]|uniref:spore germination protein n=1 Tax=Bacillus toyonensis TaxID=155322 RepID=UPI000BEBCCE3|nr:spore germination protein [Bacillus toyonensis]PDZ25562.1 spore germination protein [Bacillus toyonensis]PEO26181.1 spore germination protein [Bacillus toyonensis]PGE66796.1 spore germination protein [Bacillus toyonensis]PHD44372.1 spore germination protein [Bacillus toyonensis]
MEDNRSGHIISNEEVDIRSIKEMMQNTDDLIMKNIALGDKETTKNTHFITVLYLSNLADPTPILNKLIQLEVQDYTHCAHDKWILEELSKTVKITQVKTVEEVVDQLIYGSTVFLFSNQIGISIDSLDIEIRSVKEPDNEVTIKGPHDGFTESLKSNIALIRFHLPTPKLKVEYTFLGSVSKQKIAIVSVSDSVAPQILAQVHKRIKTVQFDAVLDSHYISEWITDNKRTIFPLTESTERPDRVVDSLIEGRIAILVNGSPWVVLVPYIFLQTFQSSEDNYWHYYISSILRVTRLFCGIITLFLSGLFIAAVSFHHEFLPTSFLMSIAQGREPISYPVIVEVLMMEVTFEILREAGVRLPRQTGQAVSIVGALVLGQAAVQAGIISPITVIVVSLTGICSFTLSAQSAGYALRTLRFLVIIFAGFLGFIGMAFAGMLILIHLASLHSFGVPYLNPFRFSQLVNLLIRRPLPMNSKKNSVFHKMNVHTNKELDKWKDPRSQTDN